MQCFFRCWFLLVLPLLAAGPLAVAEDGVPRFPASPRLATTAAELAARKTSPEFPALRDAAIKAAAPHVGDGVPLPDDFGSWIFYYACPDDGSTLRMITLDEHECPQCKKRYMDEQTAAAYRCQMHYHLERAAESLGWAYAYTDEEPYVRAVKRILLHLADEYATYPARHDRWGNTGLLARLGGRRYVQSLDEAVGIIRLAKAYDLTRGSPLWTDAERRHVERDLFRATADTLLVFNQGINNHQTWYNAGLMSIASVLADAELVKKTLTMPGGFYYQLDGSLGDDGLWYEGTMAYQNYALQAMVEIVDAGRRMGLALHEEPRFKALLRSPLKVAYPNGAFPCINDSDPSSFKNFNWSYEWAWRVYRDPVFAQAAAWGNPEKLKSMLGPDAMPEWPLETGSLDLGDLGVAVLRVGKDAEAACLFFDYGRHGGGHGHYDKLNITLFAAGREWLFDTGRIGYTHKEYKTWVKQTVAHNTVVLNAADQQPTKGKLLWMKIEEGYAACAGESLAAYPGATLRRYLLLTPKLLVDVFEVETEKSSTIDWLAHAVTAPVVPVGDAGTPRPAVLGKDNGYQHLSQCRQWSAGGGSQWDFPDSANAAKKLRVWLPPHPGEAVYTAVGIGNYATQQAPCLIRRRQADKTRFVTVYDLSGKGDSVQKLISSMDNPLQILVETSDGRWQITFGNEGVQVDH